MKTKIGLKIEFSVFALLSLLCVTSCNSPAKENTPPNIIIFLVDDMGLMDTSVPFLTDTNGNSVKYPLNDYYKTPNMEMLAEQGIRFTNFDQLINIAALIDIDRIGMRYCLGIPHAGWRTVIETRGETNTFGKLLITIPACRTFFQIDVSGFGN